jgi:hypothetical protein
MKFEIPFHDPKLKFQPGDQTGKMSTFGGPGDTGVAVDEGLALIEPDDLKNWWFRYLFLRTQPPGTTGLARRLDPDAFYLAMRWDYTLTPRSYLRSILCKVEANGKTILCRPVDWGPNESTNRIADLSPGAASYLDLITDDMVTITVPEPA